MTPSDPQVRVLPVPDNRRPPRLAYTPSEVSELIGVPLQTIYDWCTHGDLRSKKVGKRVVISVAALAEFLEMDIPITPEPRSASG